MKQQDNPSPSVGHRAPQALREKDVLDQVRFSKSQMWRLIHRGLFPKPIRISERCNAWDAQAIDAWLAEKFSAATSASQIARFAEAI